MNEYTNTTNESPSAGQPAPDFKRRNPVWAGVFVVLIGTVLLLRQTGVLFPYWLFTWPVFFIALGLFTGLRHGFRRGPWFIFLIIGTAFLIDEINTGLNLRNYIWPIFIIGAGLFLIFRPRTRYGRWRRWQRGRWQHREQWDRYQQGIEETAAPDSSDFIDITSVFSGIKKMILSKNFKGGDVVNFMGGTELNLTQADIQGRITIDAVNVFGGTKLIIPSTWDVQSDVTCIFGGVDDKRQFNGETTSPGKIIHLDGVCLFGGIEIRSF